MQIGAFEPCIDTLENVLKNRLGTNSFG